MSFGIIDVSTLKRYENNRDVVIIDCRTYDEYARGHFPGATHIGSNGISARIKMFPKDKKIIFYCDRGANSMIAARRASELGYEAYSVIGGYQAIKSYNL